MAKNAALASMAKGNPSGQKSAEAVSHNITKATTTAKMAQPITSKIACRVLAGSSGANRFTKEFI
jgi:hypothetical protein